MIIAERVNAYIIERGRDAMCDACIAKALDLRHQQTNQVTTTLGTTSDFNRWLGVCADCGKEQKVTSRA